MCVGALLESDADGVVYALADPVSGAAGSVVQLAAGDRLPRRLHVVSGILQGDAAELRRRAEKAPVAARGAQPSR